MGFYLSKDLLEVERLGPKLAFKLKAWSPVRGSCPGQGCVSPGTRALKGQARAPDTVLIPEDRGLSPPSAQSLQGRGCPHGAATFLCSSAECSVTGDIHFTTFDGRRYTFPATCQYILAKSRSSGTFTVTLQNAPCGLVRTGGFRAGPQVFLQPTEPSVYCSWAEQCTGDWVLALEHLRVTSCSWASVFKKKSVTWL